MDNMTSTENGGQKGGASAIAVGIGILSAAVLAYCGYKLIDNKLSKTEYEPDPNKGVSTDVPEQG